MLRKTVSFLLLAALALAVACSSNRNSNAARNDKESVEKSLDQAGFNDDIRVDFDKDKRVISLNGRVRSPELKAKAGEVAAQAAPGDVVSNQLSVEPVDQEATAKKIEQNLHDAIEKNYEALLVANHMDNLRIRFYAKNGVLTLEGRVKTPDQRMQAQRLASSVPNVEEVVNKLDVDQDGVQQAAEPR